MMIAGTTKVQTYLVTTGVPGQRSAVHSHIEGLNFPTMSPSGRQALVDDRAFKPAILNLVNLHITRLATPKGWGAFEGPADNQRLFQPETDYSGSGGSGVFWPTPDTVIADPGRRLAVLNVATHTWRMPVSGPVLLFCPLPNRRVLFAKAAGNGLRLYLMSTETPHLIPVSSDQLGTIENISCPVGGPSVYLSVGSDPATVYVALAATIDGSPLTTK
jgi:hypothetical protein